MPATRCGQRIPRQLGVEMGVDVDEAGSDQTSLGIDLTSGRRVETTVVEVTVSGDQATATLRGGEAGSVELIKIDEKWYVTALRT